MIIARDSELQRKLEEQTQLCEQLQNEVTGLRAVLANKNASLQLMDASRAQEDVAKMTEEVFIFP